MQKYFAGLKFGLMLQLAVGPMCLMVFNYSQNSGFWVAFSLVLAIALVDAFYILLAGFGVSKLLSKPSIKNIIKIVGSIILFIFGLNIILGVFGINIIPGLNLKPNSSSAFIQGIILTLSNPMTIILWGGVLTTKLVDENFSKRELLLFSIGLVSSTLLFLTMVAFLGMILSSFLPSIVTKILNILVGLLIIFFGVKLLLKK